MRGMKQRLATVATGGVLFGVLQSFGAINFNQIWFQFLATWLSALISIFFGGDPTEFTRA